MQRGGPSWITTLVVALIGVAVGVGAGLYYAWQVSPVIMTNTAPWQLSKENQQRYLIAISLAYARDHDLNRMVTRITDLRLGDQTWLVLADTACQLARSSYASTNSGLTAIRSMVELAQSQGATGCASTLLPLYTSTPAPTPTTAKPTATLSPPATKTPTPTLGPTFTPATQPFTNLTPTPAGDFKIVAIEALCNPKRPGMIDIVVQDSDSTGLPAIPVEVSFAGGKDDFFTGLEPERGPGLADFQMTAGESYTVALPGLSEQSRPIEASPCNVVASDGGGKSVTSYRVTFRRLAH
jgi:hypothetical protein